LPHHVELLASRHQEAAGRPIRVDRHLDVRQQPRRILDFIEDHRPALEPPEESSGIGFGKLSFQGIVEGDIPVRIATKITEQRCLARLPWSGNDQTREFGSAEFLV